MSDQGLAGGEASNRLRMQRGTHLHDKVHAVLAKGGPMTADEVAAALGESILSIRPRVSELVSRGMVKASGHRGLTESGRTAAKWVLA